MLNPKLLSGAIMASILSLSPSAYASTLYSIEEIGSFANTAPRPFPPVPTNGAAINNNGQVAGSYIAYNQHGTNYAYITKAGDIHSLDSFAGVLLFTSANGYGVNNAGQLVGTYVTSSNVQHAFVTINGVRTDLGTLGGSTSAGYGLNDAGQAVGSSLTNTGLSHAFISTNGVMADLGTLGGDSSTGYDVNNLGQVTGTSATSNGDQHAFITNNGTMVDLGTLGGNISNGYGINDNGQVVGSSTLANTNDTVSHAFVTINGVMSDLGSLGGGNSVAYGINACGQVVGEDIASGHAFVTINGVMTDLNTLIDPSTGWTLSKASGINDSGQITGVGTNQSGIKRAFLLTAVPVPVPAALWLFGSGLAGLGVFARRNRKMAVSA